MHDTADLRISVIVPTYNSPARLKATLGSVCDQHFPAAEIIVVDDGSTDDTIDVANIFADRIRYVRTANGGQQRARNHGVSLSTGNWIALLDHDDLWEKEYLAEVNALVRAHGVDMTMCNSRTWEEDGQGGRWANNHRFTQFAPPGYWKRVGADPTDHWSILERYDYAAYLEFHPLQTSMVTIRRDLYAALGGYDERMRGNGAENLEFEMRALRAARVGLIWQPLVKMVRHDANASLDMAQMAIDVTDCLRFATLHHGLNDQERGIVERERDRRLTSAIYGAFELGKYDAVRTYWREYRGARSWKMYLKYWISLLPRPAARILARWAGAGQA